MSPGVPARFVESSKALVLSLAWPASCLLLPGPWPSGGAGGSALPQPNHDVLSFRGQAWCVQGKPQPPGLGAVCSFRHPLGVLERIPRGQGGPL